MTVQSIERSFALMRVLALGPMGVTELAERVDLPKSTAARLLAALEAEQAVEQTEAGGEYRLGPGLIDLAGSAPRGRNLVAAARPHLVELAESLDEVTGLSIVEGSRVYYLDQTESSSNVQVRDWTGEYAPLHAVPSGLVILAQQPTEVIDKYLASPLVKCTPWTVTDPGEIRDRLSQARSLGYAWVYEEFAADLNSVAAPIFEEGSGVEAALHVHGPAYRFPNPDNTHDIGMAVIEAARRLAMQLSD
ncbi:MAG: IclR family transcriptional regulator [Acidimicrobiaceae bacterium]|nr:IclR family transcriptional regulator [Acidimicrobiaceae bacterium]MCY4176803.1 IclR family transcriptional regulator [Acidimicrobiaceae bacterium]MCY4279753.1 IclR family transcriptional regulator [Acidimicrobiaceae bacterium]MCY4295192.1 IclR family transcriptional regulator [Acidimicrobiaceae bacterium]